MVSWSMAMVLAGCAVAGPAASPPPTYTRNVAIVVYPDAEPLDFTGPFEVYNDAAGFGSSHDQPAFNVYLVGKTAGPVDAQGLTVVARYGIADAPKPDIVIFPGGPAGKVHGDPEFMAWADKAAHEAQIAQSVCTGAFVLAKAGMLDGLDATTHYQSLDRLRQAAPTARIADGRRFVDDGQVVTTAGISAGIDGSLHVVARLLGRRVADQVAEYMEYRWTPEPYLARSYAYLNPSTDDRGRAMQRADLLFQDHDLAGAEAGYRAILAEDPGEHQAWFNLGQVLRDRDPAGAAAALIRSVDGAQDPHEAARVWYAAAEDWARAGQRDQALGALREALASGWTDRDRIRADPDLASIRDDAEKLLATR